MVRAEVKGYDLSLNVIQDEGKIITQPIINVTAGNYELNIGCRDTIYSELLFVKTDQHFGYFYPLREIRKRNLSPFPRIKKFDLVGCKFYKNDALEKFFALNGIKEYGKELCIPISAKDSYFELIDGTKIKNPGIKYIPTSAMINSSDLYFEGNIIYDSKFIVMPVVSNENSCMIVDSNYDKTPLFLLNNSESYFGFNYDFKTGKAKNVNRNNKMTAEGLVNILSLKAKDGVNIEIKEVLLNPGDGESFGIVFEEENGKLNYYKTNTGDAILIKYIFDVPGYIDDVEKLPDPNHQQDKKDDKQEDIDQETKTDKEKPKIVN